MNKAGDSREFGVIVDVDAEETKKTQDIPATILLVEDEARLNFVNKLQLTQKGHTVYTAENIAGAREHLKSAQPDIILLDVDLPDGSGFDFCEEIRGTVDSHIIFVTGKTKHTEYLTGLETGGDVYIKKPYRLSELLVNIGAVMRRKNRAEGREHVINKKGFALNLDEQKAFYNDTDLNLNKKELSLLKLFLRHEDMLLDAERIYQEVWASDFADDRNAMQVTISRLRGKLEQTPYTIETKRGQGYCFQRY